LFLKVITSLSRLSTVNSIARLAEFPGLGPCGPAGWSPSVNPGSYDKNRHEAEFLAGLGRTDGTRLEFCLASEAAWTIRFIIFYLNLLIY
jgi:hypothetical protein